MTTPEEVIARVNAWRTAKTIVLEPQPGGKTNQNFLVHVDGERFVLRMSGLNTNSLGISRVTERAAILSAARIGVAPEVVAFLLPEGHLITRFIDGIEWSPQDFKRPEIILRVAATMKQIHSLPPIEGIFDPYQDIKQRLATAGERKIALPERLNEYLEYMNAIKARRAKALANHLCLCHNDPWHNNFLDDGTVRLLDWEFAGMGDPFFDLGSIAAIFSPEEKHIFLQAYFGEDTPGSLHELNQMIYIVFFWNATWALLQIGIDFTDIDYAQMAGHLFEAMQGMMEAQQTFVDAML